MPGGLVRGPYEDTQEEVRVAVEAETDPGSFKPWNTGSSQKPGRGKAGFLPRAFRGVLVLTTPGGFLHSPSTNDGDSGESPITNPESGALLCMVYQSPGPV